MDSGSRYRFSFPVERNYALVVSFIHANGEETVNVLLSIVIPIYNAHSYLQTCLDSILSAELRNLELLLIDDGSVDGSLDIAKTYAAKNSNVRIFTRDHSGPSAARNFGASIAQGKYLCFFDADDYVDPKAFAGTVEHLKTVDADIVASDFHRVTDSGVILDRVYQIRSDEPIITEKEYLQEYVSAPDCVWNVWRYIFRRDFLVRDDLSFCEGYNCAEDLQFVVRALMTAERIAYIHKPYYNYRVNYGPSLTRQFTSRRTQDMTAMFASAWAFLDDISRVEAKTLQGKISREYILSLSLYSECKSAEKDAILSSLQENTFLLSGANGTAYKAAACFVKMFGIPAASRILHVLKLIKRMIRRQKGRRTTRVS